MPAPEPHFAIHCHLMLFTKLMVEPVVACLYKGRGVLGKATEAACGDLCAVYAAPHSHAQETATRHVQDVTKKETYTSKQTQNNNPTTKQRLHQKPSCAVLETPTSRKDRETLASTKHSHPETTNKEGLVGDHR